MAVLRQMPTRPKVSFKTNLNYFRNIFSLRPFRSVSYLELDILALDQRLISIAANCAVVDKNILFARLLDETIPFGIVEPLYLAICF